MDDVEAARAEPEVERGDVDDDLVALAHLPQQRLVGPGRPALAVDLDRQRLRGDDDAAAQLQPAAHAAASAARRGDDPLADLEHRRRGLRPATCSSAVWTASVPLASRTQSKPSRRKALASLPPPIAVRSRLEPGAAQARLGQRQRRRGRRHLVAAEELFDPHVDVAAVLAGAPGAGVGDLPGDLGRPLGVEAARLGVDPAVAGDDVARGAAA